MAWGVEFLATEEEVPVLRRGVRTQLGQWGLADLTDDAQLCVSELVANVIGHVGPGTPTTLTVLVNGASVRIEVHDPDPRALPTLMAADAESEAGRGLALVAAITDRWGIQLLADHKVTWCELATVADHAAQQDQGPWARRAEAVIDLYRPTSLPHRQFVGRLGAAHAEEVTITVITDLLHWVRLHGRDADDVLDRAQLRFESQTSVIHR
ncbi:ATP-binding protein [Streptomyces sp. TRM76130]|nr:ATP-binding protein [Streptomyces sp. TRM76130]